jgi:anti-anti-sigma regulatory factor
VIKIIKHHRDGHGTVIQLQGRLDEEGLAELRAVVNACVGEPIAVDLSGLVSTDGAGREYLIGLRRSGAALYGGSLYITKLLEEAQP